MKIQVRNEQQRMRIPEETASLLLHQAADRLRRERPGLALWAPEAELTVAFVDADRMRELNLAHKGRDRSTDVLAFDYGIEPDIESDAPAAWTGEIIVCADEAIGRSAEFGNAPGNELAVYLLHGLLHLAGFDDHDQGDRDRMREEEERLIAAAQRPVDPDRAFVVVADDDEADRPGRAPTP